MKTPVSTSININKRKFTVETGYIPTYSLHHFVLLFDKDPIWLLALERQMVDKIYMPNFESMSAFHAHLTSRGSISNLYNRAVTRLGLHRFIFAFPALHTNSLTLISGSIDFLNSFTNKDLPFIFVCDSHLRVRRKSPRVFCSLFQIKHTQCGGATSYSTQWGSNLPNFTPQFTTIRRTVGDFIDHSIRPQSAPSTMPSHAYTEDSLINPDFFYTPILYKTSFVAKSRGYRQLTVAELSRIVGLPSWFTSLPLTLTDLHFVPCQILEALLRPALSSFEMTESKRRKLPPMIHEPDRVFIPALQAYMSTAWQQSAQEFDTSVKHDDAETNMQLWDLRTLCLFPKATPHHLEVLRRFFFQWSIVRLYQEFISYLRTKYKQHYTRWLNGRVSRKKLLGGTSTSDKMLSSLCDEINSGTSALYHYVSASYSKWEAGSSLFFWRWHPDLREVARNSFPGMICGPLPTNKNPTRRPKQDVYDPFLLKILSFLKKQYLRIRVPTDIFNNIDYFAVPKGLADIRPVFNGTSCGFNDSVFAPNFWLPMLQTMTRALHFNYRVVDIDLGEMFINFPLHPTLIPYSGIDVTPFKDDILKHYPEFKTYKSDRRLFCAWTRCWMGFRPSPEWAARYYYLAEEFIRGDEAALDNPLRWDSIELNLLGCDDFNPALPFLFKWDAKNFRIACEILAYVDDLRIVAATLELAWQVARRVASRLQYLGIQDAPRKRRIDNGPWAGTTFGTDDGTISKSVTIKKWNKAKNYLAQISNDLAKSKDHKFDYKFLESVRGFLCHLAMTYEILFPYLKGFHLTLSAHLPKRDKEGWALSDDSWLAYLNSDEAKGHLSQEQQDHMLGGPQIKPKSVTVVPRFLSCLNALNKFFETDVPPVINTRTKNVSLIIYGFVDASKPGFGAMLDSGNKLKYRIGIWGRDSEDESSNWREFANLVETLESEASTGILYQSTVILATDNSTVEACLYKGNSKSEKLYDLVVRFRVLEMRMAAKFYITHVSGKRMMAQGTDGVSRGHLREGVSIGEAMLSFCPWGRTALERCDTLENWIKTWAPQNTEFLTPKQWFARGHDHVSGYYDQVFTRTIKNRSARAKGFYRLRTKSGTFVWSPPPIVTDAALEQLRKARLKRRDSLHIILVPHLFTPMWYKQLSKACDMIFEVQPTHSFWSSNMYESLVIGFCFPYIKHRPWQLRGTPKMLSLARKMRAMFKIETVDHRYLLSQLLLETRQLSTMPASVVWRVLHFGSRTDLSSKEAGILSRRRRKRTRSRTPNGGMGKKTQKTG